jgi:hypothetical protein
MADPNFWLGALAAVILGIAVTGLFFVLSVALISPPSANRALPVRIYLTLFWGLSGLLSLGWSWQTGDGLWMLVWTYWTAGLMVIVLVATISNSDQLSLRVRRTISRPPWKRFAAFLFFNGAAGGLVWVVGIFGATYLIGHAVTPVIRTSAATMTEEDWHKLSTMAAYACAYALTALFIHRKFLPGHPPKLTGLLAVLLAAGWAIAPSIFLFFANRLSWKTVEGLQLGNVFNVGFDRDHNHLVYHECFACGWLLLALVLNTAWFLRQVRNFQPPAETKEPTGIGIENT